jgi:hypothetical protein
VINHTNLCLPYLTCMVSSKLSYDACPGRIAATKTDSFAPYLVPHTTHSKFETINSGSIVPELDLLQMMILRQGEKWMNLPLLDHRKTVVDISAGFTAVQLFTYRLVLASLVLNFTALAS